MAEMGVTVRSSRCVSRALLYPPTEPLCPPPNEPHLLWPSSCPDQRSAGFIECLTGHYQSDITCITWLSLLPHPRNHERLMSGRRHIHCHARLSSATRGEDLGCGCLVMALSSLIHKDGPPCGLISSAGQLLSAYIAILSTCSIHI